MSKSQHLTFQERQIIEKRLSDAASFRQIAREIGKDPGTITKEIRKNSQTEQVGGWGTRHNACRFRRACAEHRLCPGLVCKRRCCFCEKCNQLCPRFQAETCLRLERPPYVCNGCAHHRGCQLTKQFYKAVKAQNVYRRRLSDSRSGISYTAQELKYLDQILTPLVKRKQSLHAICVSQKDRMICSERTLYHLIDKGALAIRNLDLPRKVRYRPRQKARESKVDRRCRENRTFQDFHAYRLAQPGLVETQMDSVIGRIGGKVLLTIFWPQAQFMLLLLREQNTSQSVIDCFNWLQHRLGLPQFRRLFPVLLGDNGSEFSNPTSIEQAGDGAARTRVFYCDPQKPEQKPGIERNHEFIRQVLPQGTSFDRFCQADMDLLASHINAYLRPSLNDRSPSNVFAFLFGQATLDDLAIRDILPCDVDLSPNLLAHPSATSAWVVNDSPQPALTDCSQRKDQLEHALTQIQLAPSNVPMTF